MTTYRCRYDLNNNILELLTQYYEENIVNLINTIIA